jgi:hypothetical protein
MNLSYLHNLAQDLFPECMVKAFKLGQKSTPSDSIETFNNDADLALYAHSTSEPITLWIASECKGFREFKLAEAVEYAGADRSEPDIDDTLFPSEDFPDDDATINGILDHAVQDIMCKIPIFGPISAAQNEASVRELIGPVLVAGARIAGDIRLVNEKYVTGSRGAGPVDYAALYKNFNVVITEAKKDSLETGLGQNIAQIVSAREEYLYVTAPRSNKRKFAEYAPEIASVPSFGAVSTADKWIFTLYRGSQLYRTNTHPVPLEINYSSEADVRKALLPVIRILVGILNAQKAAVDANEYTRQEGPVRRLK